MKLVKLGLVCGALLLAACSGEDGAQGQPGEQGPAGPGGTGGEGSASSINGITPSLAVAGRTVEISISGDNTTWSDTAKPTVDFGAGATVTSLTVASPTAIVATVEFAADATAGVFDVKVGEQTYKGFRVLAPIAAEVLGEASQGSLVLARITNADRENPFDTTGESDFFGNVTYTNFAAGAFQGSELSESIGAQPIDVRPNEAIVAFFVDANAAAASYDLVTLSGPDEASSVSSFLKGGLTVAARTATPVTAPTAVSLPAGQITSALFSYQLPAGADATKPVAFNFVPASVDAEGYSMALLPGGKWADQLDGTSATLAAADVLSIVVFQQGNTTPVEGTVVAHSQGLTGTATNEAEPNEDTDTATAITLPANVSAEIVAPRTTPQGAAPDVDTYSFTATAGAFYAVDLFPRTAASRLDSIITVLNAEGDVVATADNTGAAGIESLAFKADAAGTYHIVIEGYVGQTASTGLYSLSVAAVN